MYHIKNLFFDFTLEGLCKLECGTIVNAGEAWLIMYRKYPGEAGGKPEFHRTVFPD